MKLTKTPLYYPDTNVINGYNIEIKCFFYNFSLKGNALYSLREKESYVEYKERELYDQREELKNDIKEHDGTGDNDLFLEKIKKLDETEKELNRVKSKLEEIRKEVEVLENEIDREYEKSFSDEWGLDSEQEDDEYEYVSSSQDSCKIVTKISTQSSWLEGQSEDFGDLPPHIVIYCSSQGCHVEIIFFNGIDGAGKENCYSLNMHFVGERYGESKYITLGYLDGEYYDVGGSFWGNIEWVRQDKDYVDDNIGYWDNPECHSTPGIFNPNISFSPDSFNIFSRAGVGVNITELSCCGTWHDSGNCNIDIKVINGNAPVEGGPGFLIADCDESLDYFEKQIFTESSPFRARELFRKLNKCGEEGVKAGQMLLVTNPADIDNNRLAELQGASAIVNQAFEDVDGEGIGKDFFLKHYATIANFSSLADTGVSLAGVAGEVYFSQINTILKDIEKLYKTTFAGLGALTGDAFFIQRGKLFSDLDNLLRKGFLGKALKLGNYSKIKSALSLSSKSIVHHWKDAGVTEIPGYSTYLRQAGKLIKIMKGVGYVGIGFSAVGAANEIYQACSVGREKECTRQTYTEIGTFTGSVGGAYVGSSLSVALCVPLTAAGVWPGLICGIAVSVAGGIAGGAIGESTGKWLYNTAEEN